MKFPIFDGLRSSGKRAQNAAQLEQVTQARIDRERSIAIEQRTADRELEKDIALDEAARKAHDATVEALRMSRESFDQGLIASLDLLQAERAGRQAEQQAETAYHATQAAESNLGLARRAVQPGEMLNPGQTAFEIVDNRKLEIRADLPAEAMAQVKARDRDAEVFVAEQGMARRHKVVLGREQDGYRPVSGLGVGAQVIDSGKDLVGEGSPLRVISGAAPTSANGGSAAGGK